MPSFRRTVSSPFPRSSPYSSSSLSGAQTRGHGRRRSSGSETSSRRVLADIEWWTVTEGQCDPSAVDQESEEPIRDGAETVVADAMPEDSQAGVEHLSIPSAFWPTTSLPASETQYALPTAEFAALSLESFASMAPQTPPPRHFTLEAESPNSSLESTPEGPSPLELGVLRLDLAGMGPIFFEDHFTRPLPAATSLGRADGGLFDDIFSLQQDDFGSSCCFESSSFPALLTPSFVC